VGRQKKKVKSDVGKDSVHEKIKKREGPPAGGGGTAEVRGRPRTEKSWEKEFIGKLVRPK